MWLSITLIIGTSVLFLELLKFLPTYKSCLYNYTLLDIKRLYLEATEIEYDFCFEFCILGLVWSRPLPEPSKKFLEEEKFTLQRKLSNVILDHDIVSALVLNLDQTPFLMSLPGSIYFHQRGQKVFPLKGLMTKGKLQQLL